jgi:hypothetical protein
MARALLWQSVTIVPEMPMPRITSMSALLLAACCLCLQPLHADPMPRKAATVVPLPPQLQATVPYEPSAFRSDGKQRLVYELLLRNFADQPLQLQELAVLADAAADAAPLAVFDATQLPALLRRVGPSPAADEPLTTLPAGASAIVYLLLSFDADTAVPARLRHRLRTSMGDIITAAIGTRHDAIPVLGAPLTGGGWLAETGLSNANGHRRGLLVFNGNTATSRRYAFDWVRVEGEAWHTGGEAADNATYFGYGAPVVAVADAVVVRAVDAVPENRPGPERPVPLTLDTIAGNSVVLDLGQGRYAHYMHLQRGSVRVKVGERVRRGQVLGRLGNSGDSYAPHLHFELTTAPAPLAGEGLPYVITSFQARAENGDTVPHTAELPLEKMLVEFGR